MIKVPEVQEVMHVLKGSKPVLKFELVDSDYNAQDVSAHTFTCAVVDSDGNAVAGVCSVEVGSDNTSILLTIDTTNLTAGKVYKLELEDTTLALAIATIEIHVNSSIIHT